MNFRKKHIEIHLNLAASWLLADVSDMLRCFWEKKRKNHEESQLMPEILVKLLGHIEASAGT